MIVLIRRPHNMQTFVHTLLGKSVVHVLVKCCRYQCDQCYQCDLSWMDDFSCVVKDGYQLSDKAVW